MKKDIVIIILLIWAISMTYLWVVSSQDFSRNLENWTNELVIAGVDNSGNLWDIELMKEMGIEPVKYKLIRVWRRL